MDMRFRCRAKSRVGWNRLADSIFLTYPLSIEKGKKMVATATLSAKFQISIPKAVREAQHWKAGQEFAFIPKDGGVLLVPVPTLEELRGMIPNADTSGYRDRRDRY
jgi:AbrB family looped-hinge helix DNA binding protein